MNIKMNLEKGSSYLYIKHGAINQISKQIDTDRKVLIVTDSGVPGEYVETVAAQCPNHVISVIPQGEVSKNLDNYKKLCEVLIDNGFTRSDCVIAVGGGVVGDLAGFAASTYMRGIAFYNVPTTLLAQIDSSIGGKTAVDFMGVKNCIGTFYQPEKVITDPDILKTLPERQISNGLAEALKVGLIADKALFDVLENSDDQMNRDELILRAIHVKKYVVESDEKEKGIRKILNFGHTVGHGIEVACDGKLFHGECVALGMIPLCSDEVKERVIPVLKKLKLKTKVSYDREKAYKAILHDKKFKGENITLIRVNKIGTCETFTAEASELYDLLPPSEEE